MHDFEHAEARLTVLVALLDDAAVDAQPKAKQGQLQPGAVEDLHGAQHWALPQVRVRDREAEARAVSRAKRGRADGIERACEDPRREAGQVLQRGLDYPPAEEVGKIELKKF